MSKTQVYSVDFRQGNVAPALDTNGWGPMKQGSSGPAQNPTSSAGAQGLTMSVTGDGGLAANGVYAVLGEGVLPLASRLLLRAEFDEPEAEETSQAWAVALTVKFGNETFIDSEPLVAVTCQFRPNGVRLNTPGNLEGDQAPMLITPLDYRALSPARFQLDHYFCGVNAAGRYSTGFGSLSIGAPIREDDQRLYSSGGLSGEDQTWIGALGFTLVTVSLPGTMTARLRSFSVWTWSGA
jgi:hypothetical protein